MFRARRALSPTDVALRLVALLLVVGLLCTAGAAVTTPVSAGVSGGEVAALRAAQLKAERKMRRADKQIVRLQRQRQQHAVRLKVAKRRLESAISQRGKARRRVERTERRLAVGQVVLARALRVHPNPRGAQIPDKPVLRKRVRKLEAELARLEKRERKLSRRVERAREIKQARSKKVSKARIVARKLARERAEDKLGARITQMLELSRRRADSGFGTVSTRSFTRPARGSISQPYGCTGYRANPRRGSCAHFHDGLDIATVPGAKVRASADGFVAYVGFSPWDAGPRSYVVIIGHADGYETVYAHLKPVRKVRAGQRVRRGEFIGVVGMTGRTTGPHVHWEVRHHGRMVSPLRAGG